MDAPLRVIGVSVEWLLLGHGFVVLCDFLGQSQTRHRWWLFVRQFLQVTGLFRGLVSCRQDQVEGLWMLRARGVYNDIGLI